MFKHECLLPLNIPMMDDEHRSIDGSLRTGIACNQRVKPEFFGALIRVFRKPLRSASTFCIGRPSKTISSAVWRYTTPSEFCSVYGTRKITSPSSGHEAEGPSKV